ncbi:hypothetical protein MNBD_BACTEROID03-2657 [hydrothermal vent metagenome]|uniref:Fido domain-containing protein n=1 Tax=hydrothermal vent metagenome TaxID=652676 RepID=A0A3B0SYH7_9ZZZZ
MKELNLLLDKYRKQNISLSLEDEREMLYQYVYYTNKLEGNKLTLAQTSQLLSSDTISGNNIRASDILEQKGMYKALVYMIRAVRNKEMLSTSLLTELNWLAIGPLWKSDDSYLDSKQKGQTMNGFKVSQNVIQIRKGAKLLEQIEPLSNPENVQSNMEDLVQSVFKSKANIIDKVSFLAQELWLHQPFMDGNKRTGRLAINFLTMKEGFPLFIFEDRNKNYNSVLIEQFRDNKPGLVSKYIEVSLSNRMNQSLNLNKGNTKNRGYRMLL